ncbi:MAG: sialidase family protein [Bryobacteraceae bacterium]
MSSEEWDMPAPLVDLADVKDTSPVLWSDNGLLYLVWGGSGLAGTAFRWRVSPDRGASWGPVQLPHIVGRQGDSSAQPISTMLRRADGTIYLAGDAVGSASFLWATRDGGRSWFDTGGRTGGRHTVFARLRDGSLLGLGGKASDIEGYMPMSVSRDGGRTWDIRKSPFPALGPNKQRPALIRLASGRLFYAGDWQNTYGQAPPGLTQRGAFVALSSDEGATWRIKNLPGALPHARYALRRRPGWPSEPSGHPSLSYAVAAQAPNGVIHLAHLLTTTRPSTSR